MKFSKRFFRSYTLLAILLVGAVLLLRAGYDRFQKSFYPLRYTEYVEKYAQEYHLEPALVYAVIRSESNFDADARSRSGACGLMQLMPDTFDWLQESQKDTYSEEDLFRPEVNIRYGCRYLSMMAERYGSLRTALCAYNAGSGTVDGWLKDSRYSADGKNLKRIPYEETQNYADSVLQSYDKYKKLYQL
ncbi:lytic transglycosylase domain-containing protein [Caproiciproducens sp. NJN-50]|uniref:lytic transglycosylase domain-containing protein n=1 Tax=Acutalibacteraceae TaxID=3082771 RepID=UPI000FFE0E7D|nr:MULTISPECIES: lytic transglycosylase domain-containing protein [Acutalibacteraceae]QAT49510.1 lytic transglycosylase domain-containing protein [Caproiciproducens sp. NJN-50]